MYAPTSMPFVRRTRATLRSAELGFFGVVVYTRVHTPRRCGAATFFFRPLPDFRPGVASFFFGVVRPLRISWLVVGMRWSRVAGAGVVPAPAYPQGSDAPSSPVRPGSRRAGRRGRSRDRSHRPGRHAEDRNPTVDHD